MHAILCIYYKRVDECPCAMVASSNVNIFRITRPLWGESTGHRRITLTNASDPDLESFLWSEQTFEQTIDTPGIWDASAHYDLTLMHTY